MKDKTINNIIQAWWNIQILVFLPLFILAPYRPLPLWCMICACSLLIVCANLRFEDMKASELIKAMKQQSWRQLYLNSTMCLVEYSSKEYLGDKLSIEVGKRRKDGRGFDWDSSRSRSFDMEETDWRQTIGIIRSILEPTINEIDR